MTILDKIIAFKKKEIAKIKAEVPLKKLVESPSFARQTWDNHRCEVGVFTM